MNPVKQTSEKHIRKTMLMDISGITTAIPYWINQFTLKKNSKSYGKHIFNKYKYSY